MNVIKREIVIDAAISKVWTHITDPAKIAGWLMPNDFEGVVDKSFTLDCQAHGNISCVVKEIIPEQKLVYSFTSETIKIDTTVTILLTPEEGRTRVTLIHSGWDALPPPDAGIAGFFGDGWGAGLEQLREQVKNNKLTQTKPRMKLLYKVAVITGGNSGIGLATAREFVANGAKVAIFGRDRQTLDRAVASLGSGALAVQGDVRRLEDLERLFTQVSQRFGKIDILVANAGIAKFAPVESLSEQLFDELSDILFKGAFFTVQKALPYLRDGASVVLVGSADADKQGRMLTSVYTAAKSAVRALARSLSVELLPRHIRVNVLSPGMTDTPIITREGGLPGATPEQIATTITKTIPLRRRGTPEEMAKAMLFLASDDSSYCVGSELMADGGMTQLVNP